MSTDCPACKYSSGGVCVNHQFARDNPHHARPGAPDIELMKEKAMLSDIDNSDRRAGGSFIESCMRRVDGGRRLTGPQRKKVEEILEEMEG